MTPRTTFADRKERRRQKRVFFAVAVLILGYGLFAGDHRPHHLALLYLEERRAEREIDELRQAHADAVTRHDRILADPFTLESLARDKGMIRPGEIVYRIVPVPETIGGAGPDTLEPRGAVPPDSIAD